MGVDELIDQAKSLGLDGICLTDHDCFWSVDETRSLSRKHGFLVVPGVEINTDGGHLLVFGLDRYVFGLHKPPFLRQLVERRGGVVIAAHPYRRRFLEEPAQDPQARAEMLERAAADRFFRACDAIEGINGRGTPEENRFSRELSEQLDLRTTGGSDTHRLEQLGTVATRFDNPVSGLADLIEEIRAGRFQAVALRQPVEN